jgi:hypothetical protein
MSEFVGKFLGNRRVLALAALLPIFFLLVTFFVVPLAGLFKTSLAPGVGQGAAETGFGNYWLRSALRRRCSPW